MRKALIAVGSIVIVLAVAVGIWTVATRDTSTEVDVDEVAAEASSDDAVAVDAGNRPAAGTYRMAGAGTEQVTLLNGSEHVFGDEIAQTVSFDAEGCELTSRFDWIDESVMNRQICAADDGIREIGYDTAITFFGITTERGYVCPDGDDAYWYRDGDADNTARERTCEGDGTTMTTNATYVGTETVEVGGEQVEVRRIETTNAFEGGTTGESTTTFWLADNGLVVRVKTNASTATNTALGDSDYDAQYDYTLTSMMPVSDAAGSTDAAGDE